MPKKGFQINDIDIAIYCNTFFDIAIYRNTFLGLQYPAVTHCNPVYLPFRGQGHQNIVSDRYPLSYDLYYLMAKSLAKFKVKSQKTMEKSPENWSVSLQMTSGQTVKWRGNWKSLLPKKADRGVTKCVCQTLMPQPATVQNNRVFFINKRSCSRSQSLRQWCDLDGLH